MTFLTTLQGGDLPHHTCLSSENQSVLDEQFSVAPKLRVLPSLAFP